MAGEVWEWTQDRYHSSYDGAPTDGSAREDLLDFPRVFRGGSWARYFWYAWTAGRGHDTTFRGDHVGLRPARSR
jgi:formylglycine-generating enzyme required for sulfatase activity